MSAILFIVYFYCIIVQGLSVTGIGPGNGSPSPTNVVVVLVGILVVIRISKY